MASKAKRALYAAKSFTEMEASAKLGKPVRLLADRNHFRQGTIGHVVDFHATSNDEFEVVIRWEEPGCLEPVYDRVSKSKYRLFVFEEAGDRLASR